MAQRDWQRVPIRDTLIRCTSEILYTGGMNINGRRVNPHNDAAALTEHGGALTGFNCQLGASAARQ
jgi:hypothetical protein